MMNLMQICGHFLPERRLLTSFYTLLDQILSVGIRAGAARMAQLTNKERIEKLDENVNEMSDGVQQLDAAKQFTKDD